MRIDNLREVILLNRKREDLLATRNRVEETNAFKLTGILRNPNTTYDIEINNNSVKEMVLKFLVEDITTVEAELAKLGVEIK